MMIQPNEILSSHFGQQGKAGKSLIRESIALKTGLSAAR